MSLKNLFKELVARGCIQDHTPGIEKILASGPEKIYLGIDPTADSLHVGHLAALMVLHKCSQEGHQSLVVIGGATGAIGDPSFKATERPLLSEEVLLSNQQSIKKQVKKLFEGTKKKPEIYNNLDWYKKFSLLSFLREVAKYIPVGYMLAKEAVKNRLSTGLSYTEFSYPLLQAYDFYYLFRYHGVRIQLGGSDQWGNLTTGIEFIRKKFKKEGHAFTFPLITRADGSKFGKSEKGANIWLAPEKTTPYQFYQFWLHIDDKEVLGLLKRMTPLPLPEINQLAEEHKKKPHERILQKRLAESATEFVHGEQAVATAKEISQLLFGEEKETLQLSKESWKALEKELCVIKIAKEEIKDRYVLSDLLTRVTQKKIVGSKRVCREIMASGGLSINQVKQYEADKPVPLSLLHGQYVLVKRGKRRYFLLSFC